MGMSGWVERQVQRADPIVFTRLAQMDVRRP
jgi:hypothetical protein